MLKSKVIKNFR